MKRNDLFYLYLKEVNTIEDDPKPKKKFNAVETWLSIVLLACIITYSLFQIVLEIVLKLRLK